MINFNVGKADSAIIRDIVKRAMPMIKEYEIDATAMDLSMDITAAHLNGCPLDLPKLLAADDINFVHDVFGIHRHVSRQTGHLMHHFLPRCAQRELAEFAG